MPSALYVDVHVPIAVTEALRRRGLDVLTSQDDGTTTVDDDSLLARAAELGRVLFSQDQDFLRIATQWQQQGRPFPGVFLRLLTDLHQTITQLDVVLDFILSPLRVPCSRLREHAVPRPARPNGTCSRRREHGTQVS